MDIDPTILVNLLTAAALGGGLWVSQRSLSRRQVQIEKRTVKSIEALREKIEEQNGRVDDLEQWRAKREGWQKGWEDRKDREEGADGV